MKSEPLHGDFREWNLPFLSRTFDLLDSELERLEKYWEDFPDAEMFGAMDQMEEVLGLGFVAAQRHLTSVCGILGLDRGSALKSGEARYCGLTIAEVVNHAANYWKHSDEWTLESSVSRSERTRLGVRRLGVEDDDPYTLSEILSVITQKNPSRFRDAFPPLSDWTHAV